MPTRLRDANDTYRGGLRLESPRFHATAEVGGTVFKDDQQVFEANRNFGNRTTPYLGRQLFLSDLQEAYGIRSSGVFSRFLFTSNPFDWLVVSGNFSYSRPETRTHFQRFNTGLFTDFSTAAFTTAQQFALASSAQMPHRSGGAGVEIRPVHRARLLLSWLTDRIENTGSGGFNAYLQNDYSQADADVVFDLNRQISLRGGYRYVWGDARVAVTPETGLGGTESARLNRHVGKGGFTWRAASRFQISGDLEAGTSNRVYFRTSLYDYQRMRVRARLQLTQTLSLAADLGLLNNQNTAPGADYDFLSRTSSFGVHWAPQSFHSLQLDATYSRSTLRSGTTYIAPQFFDTERSEYRDNAHIVDGTVSLPFRGRAGQFSRLSLGGSFFFSSGSRPTQHYQPLASLILPLSKAVSWTSEWRYHGFSQSFYGFEAFRTHLITTGLRISR